MKNKIENIILTDKQFWTFNENRLSWMDYQVSSNWHFHLTHLKCLKSVRFRVLKYWRFLVDRFFFGVHLLMLKNLMTRYFQFIFILFIFKQNSSTLNWWNIQNFDFSALHLQFRFDIKFAKFTTKNQRWHDVNTKSLDLIVLYICLVWQKQQNEKFQSKEKLCGPIIKTIK